MIQPVKVIQVDPTDTQALTSSEAPVISLSYTFCDPNVGSYPLQMKPP